MKIIKFFILCYFFIYFCKESFSICVVAKVGSLPITNYDVRQAGLFINKNKSSIKNKKQKYNIQANLEDFKKNFSEYLQFNITNKYKEIYLKKAEIVLDEKGNKEFLKYTKQIDDAIHYSDSYEIDQNFVLELLKNDFIWNAIVYQMQAKKIEEAKKEIKNKEQLEMTTNKILNDGSIALLSKIKDMTPVEILDVNENDIFDV